MKLFLNNLPDYLWEFVVCAHKNNSTITSSSSLYRVSLSYQEGTPIVSITVPLHKIIVETDNTNFLPPSSSIPPTTPFKFDPVAPFKVESLKGSSKIVYDFLLSNRNSKFDKLSICESTGKSPSVVSRALNELQKKQHISLTMLEGKAYYSFVQPF